MNGEELLAGIREGAYWRFLIEPRVDEPPFSTRSAARDALKKASVRLRGWDFPHFNDHGSHGDNRAVKGGWESWTVFYDSEVCRIYQSGQFIQYSTLAEDSTREGWGARDVKGPFLDFVSTIYHVTEFFEFARRLTTSAAYGTEVDLSVSLSGMAGRHLTAELARGLFNRYECQQSNISHSRTVAVDALSVDSARFSREAVHELFEDFKFETDDAVIAEIQLGLLERRFR